MRRKLASYEETSISHTFTIEMRRTDRATWWLAASLHYQALFNIIHLTRWLSETKLYSLSLNFYITPWALEPRILKRNDICLVKLWIVTYSNHYSHFQVSTSIYAHTEKLLHTPKLICTQVIQRLTCKMRDPTVCM